MRSRSLPCGVVVPMPTLPSYRRKSVDSGEPPFQFVRKFRFEFDVVKTALSAESTDSHSALIARLLARGTSNKGVPGVLA